jgi:3-methyladenine DNA glycosylase AlkD
MPNRMSQIDSTAVAISRQIAALPGPTAAALRAARRRWSGKLVPMRGRDVVRLALRLVRIDKPGHRFIAYELVNQHPGAPETLSPAMIDRLGRGIDTWGDVDVFAAFIAGPAWRAGRLKDAHVHRWARSRDRWRRRTALVCTVVLNRTSFGGTGDVPRTLAVCRMLAADSDGMVVKGLSWALRELIPHDAKAVRDFLSAHRNLLAARVLREVNNKLTTGVKNPRR